MNLENKTLLLLLVYFAILAIVFYTFKPGLFIWVVLVASALIFLLFEVLIKRPDKDTFMNALEVGIFLMIFDLIVENTGYFLGFWKAVTDSLAIGITPIEVMLICLIGGTAWALYMPKKLNLKHSMKDLLFFSFFGALGEFILIENKIMFYYGGWTSLHAFLAYLITWLLMNTMKYRANRTH